jgi:hypothetical protein
VKACLFTLLTPALAVSMTVGGAAKPTPPLPASSPVPASQFIGAPVAQTGPQPTVINSGCAALPHSCGYPDWSNSGIPYGTQLLDVPSQISSGPGWYYDPRGWVEVDGNGAVLSGLNIQCNLDISASNVTIKYDKIEGWGQSSFGISLRHTSNVTIESNDIQGINNGDGRLMVGIKDIYGDSTGTQILYNNIYMTSTGIQVAEGLIQGNFIHNMGYMPGDHINGITVSGGTEPMTIQDNTVLVNFGQTDAVSLFQDTGEEANKTITGNLLGGGGYTIYGGGDGYGDPTSNIVITNNRISTMFYPLGGIWGPVIYFSPGNGNEWWNNIWDGTGIDIPMP